MKVKRNTIARVGGVFLLAGAVTLGAATTTEAAFVVAVCDDVACTGAGDFIVNDQGAGDLDPVNAGIVVVSTLLGSGPTVAGYEFYLNTSQTKPALGTAANPVINLSYSLNNLVGGIAPNIWLYAGDTGYTGQGNINLVVNSTTTGQDTTGIASGGVDNSVGANGLALAPIRIAIGPNSDVFSASASNGPVGAAPYALAAGVLITDTGGITGTSGDVTLTVPEPASLALLGMALFGVGAAVRRRRQGIAV